jgi:rhodanese-related sulfurtransferase
MGPATEDDDVLRQLMENGMNVARFNFSHGSHDYHRKNIERVRRVAAEVGTTCAILLDTKGPEIRTGELADHQKVTLETGGHITLTTNSVVGSAECVSVTYKDLAHDVEPGTRILVDDGLIALEVESVTDTDVVCKILNGGEAAWTAAGYELDKDGEHKADAAKDFGTEVPAHPEYWVSIEDAKDRLANDDNFKLVSIRSEDEWLGKTSGYSYMDKAGEPDGAVWGKGAQSAADVADFTNEDGTVKDLAGLEEVWADCDFSLDNDLAFYCGTGWRACVPFLVLYENGYDNVAVYDGGWYEWIMHDDYPVQVGDPASDDCVHTTVGELETGKALTE